MNLAEMQAELYARAVAEAKIKKEKKDAASKATVSETAVAVKTTPKWLTVAVVVGAAVAVWWLFIRK